jgi:hypothetical protein
LFENRKIGIFSKKKIKKFEKNFHVFFQTPTPKKKFSKTNLAPNPNRSKDHPTSKLTSIVSSTPRNGLTLGS